MTTQSSTFFKSTSRSYTKWYPVTETSSTIDKNGVTFFGNSGGSSTETTSSLTDVTSIYSVGSKGISQTETVPLEPRTFPDTSNDVSPLYSTVKIETEYETQKSVRNESTTVETTYQEESTETFASIGDTTLFETNSTSGDVPTTR